MPERVDELDDAGFTPFDRTWNAACHLLTSVEAESDLAGDRALRYLVQFHGLAMNGDLEHAISSGTDIPRPALAGYRRFGLDAVADVVERGIDLIEQAPGQVDEPLSLVLEELDTAYGRLLPSDSVLVDAVQAYWDKHRDEFADRA